jgi:cellulose synthase/poly-beta-1,6-N-acetylglucosamine synthase-like glycosyltransferase
MQFHLLYYYKKYQRNYKVETTPRIDQNNYPFVTIQLPIYNELYVVERLLQSISELDYPKDKFEIHVLDDSTDETEALLINLIKTYASQGHDIHHIRRDNREGFKAGALKAAMDRANGEYIAIFDADFMPHPSFLKDTLGHFIDKKVGVVQTRWEHLNQNYSLLTRVQAFQLNVHFTIEQLGRRAGSLFLQFNGTAGVWRKTCIEAAGGWEADTLTEDLDLSYRAQLKGWKIIYLENTVSPAELPAEISGLKSQQYRWMKGGAETAKKVLPHIWDSNLTLKRKIHASMHLMGSSVFLAVFILGVFSVPLAFFINPLSIQPKYFTVFLISLLSILIIYYVANVEVAWEKESKMKMILKFIVLFPIFLALSMGLSLHNSIAVLQGYLGKKTAFVRTPKFDIRHLSDKIIKKKYLSKKLSKVTIWEGLLFIYFICALSYGLATGQNNFLLMHFLLALGYGMIFFYSIIAWSVK